MPTVLVIDDNPGAHLCVRVALPQWTILSAYDGISGLDIARRRIDRLDAIVLDVKLPDLDGRSICVLIRSISEQVPIVPYTMLPESIATLYALGCAPALLKTATSEEIAEALHAASVSPAPSVGATALLHWMHEQAAALEQIVRARYGGPRVAILASCDLIRHGLISTIGAGGGKVVADATSQATLNQALDEVQAAALVADAASLADAAVIARSFNIPVLAVTSTTVEAQTALSLAHGVLVMPIAARDLMEALAGVMAGERYLDSALRYDPFAVDGLTEDERKIISLVAQGRRPIEIAPVMQLAHNTVRHYLSRIYAKLGVGDLSGLQRWAEERIRLRSDAPGS